MRLSTLSSPASKSAVAGSPSRMLTPSLNRKTWEKVFYCLLLKYRTRHLENFEEEEAKPSRKASGSRSRKEATPPAGMSRSKRSKQSLSDLAGETVEVKPTRPKLASPPRHTPTIHRPAPPTPNAAPSSIRGPAGPGSPRSRGPLPQTPVHETSAGMYSPSVNGGNTPAGNDVPAIHLQEPTPQSADRIRDSHLLSPNTLPPPSPTPSAASNVPPMSPKLPIEIPQVDSPAMQRFFHDVVDQLQAMALRPLSPTQEQSPTFPPPSPGLPSPATPGGERMSFTPIIRARDQFKPSGHAGDASQFADADEEYGTEDATSSNGPIPLHQQLQNMYANKQGNNPTQSPIQPLSIRKSPSPNNSPLQPRRSVRQSPNPNAAPVRPGIMRPTSAFTTPVSPRVVPNRRGASSMIHTSPPPNIPGAYYDSPPDKENRGYLKSAFANSPPSGEKKRVTLGLGIAGAPQQVHGSAFETGVSTNGTSKLVKRRSKQASATPSPMFSSPTPALEAASAPKGSWFTNLFSWKTPVVSTYLSDDLVGER